MARATVRRLGENPDETLSRCHIIAARLGGSNKLKSNFSPCGQLITNNGPIGMSGFEIEVAKEIAQHPDWTARYEPFFGSADSSIPKGYVMPAVFHTFTGTEIHALSRTPLNVVDTDRGLVNMGNWQTAGLRAAVVHSPTDTGPVLPFPSYGRIRRSSPLGWPRLRHSLG